MVWLGKTNKSTQVHFSVPIHFHSSIFKLHLKTTSMSFAELINSENTVHRYLNVTVSVLFFVKISSATVHTIFFDKYLASPSKLEQVIVGAITFGLAIVFLAINIFVAVIMIKVGNFRSLKSMLQYKILANKTFALLFVNLTICECFNMIVIVLFMVPVTVLWVLHFKNEFY